MQITQKLTEKFRGGITQIYFDGYVPPHFFLSFFQKWGLGNQIFLKNWGSWEQKIVLKSSKIKAFRAETLWKWGKLSVKIFFCFCFCFLGFFFQRLASKIWVIQTEKWSWELAKLQNLGIRSCKRGWNRGLSKWRIPVYLK